MMALVFARSRNPEDADQRFLTRPQVTRPWLAQARPLCKTFSGTVARTTWITEKDRSAVKGDLKGTVEMRYCTQ
jgi:hypothetical protein